MMHDSKKKEEPGHILELTPRLARLLLAIDQTGSLHAASKKLGVSYRYSWGELKDAQKSFGTPLVESSTGGTEGGHTILTSFGKKMLHRYTLETDAVNALTNNENFWQVMSTKLSARNQISGKIKKINKDGVAAKITIEVNEPALVTSLITCEAADYLELKEGMNVKAVIKATEVMVSVD